MATVEVVQRTGKLSLPVSQLVFDSDVQCRESIQMGTVAEYKESLAASATFPPLVVFFDGEAYWVADGFHRGQAYREAGVSSCPCDVRQGTKRDAILYAVGANSTHGLKRSNADKRRAVLTLLKDTEWRQKPSRWIAEKCGVSPQTVITIKEEVRPLSNLDNASATEMVKTSDGRMYPEKRKPVEKLVEKDEPRKAIRNGKEYTIDTSNIGKVKAEKLVEKAKREVELTSEDFDEHEGMSDGKEEELGGEKVAPMFDKEEAKHKSIVDYPLVNTDTPEKIITFTLTNIRETLDEAWDRCEPSQRWKLMSKIENLLTEFKEEKGQ